MPVLRTRPFYWGDAISQVASDWLSAPLPMAPGGSVDGFSVCGANIACRFGATHNGKLRAYGDLKRNMVNLRTSVVTPITHPAWYRISQMAKRESRTKARWAFTKTDLRSAYKKPTLSPGPGELVLSCSSKPHLRAMVCARP